MSESNKRTDQVKQGGAHGRGETNIPPTLNAQRDILTIAEAADLLGVSEKTFNKVLHAQNIPARKIGREWKFSRAALIEWVGAGRSKDFYNSQSEDDEDEAPKPIKPERARRTAGWNIEY
jgi:excisionase family DNA binding protein